MVETTLSYSFLEDRTIYPFIPHLSHEESGLRLQAAFFVVGTFALIFHGKSGKILTDRHCFDAL